MTSLASRILTDNNEKEHRVVADRSATEGKSKRQTATRMMNDGETAKTSKADTLHKAVRAGKLHKPQKKRLEPAGKPNGWNK
jgi:hypothetical protein